MGSQMASDVRCTMGKDLQCLFITVTGQVKSAEPVTSGCLHSVFRQAKIDESSGNIKSTVASRRWLNNRQIEEILELERCLETFKKFYYR
ncbi:unnamed protein product, partial [Brenthis ino]